MACWEDLVVFSSPLNERLRKDAVLTAEDCEAIKLLVKYNYPAPEIPTPNEFTEIVAPLVLERTYPEVSPFPKLNCVQIAYGILTGSKIYQWRGLGAGKKYPNLRPFKAWRSPEGIVVEFIDPKTPLKTVAVPYCRRDCSTQHGTQCACFGSYSQIELRSFLPYWSDRCSAESAQTCPMRLAQGFPKPDPNDPVVKEFQEWCKTRKGYKQGA